jgi:Zn-dependent M28 family amino/carboxypeptidase
MKFKRTLLIIFILLLINSCTSKQELAGANSDNIISHIESQLGFGPRIPGSEASLQTAEYIKEVLVEYGWSVEYQQFQHKGINIRNIIAKNNNQKPRTIFGAHYDTRELSDQEDDISRQLTPVPGANDGASGTALLLDLGRVLAKSNDSYWLVFFDAEDQGHINNWDWSVGANHFAATLDAEPEFVVIVDMIGDKELNIFLEKNSDPDLCQEIWDISAQLGYSHIFINKEKYAMIDDHLSFLNKGIPACLLIDFDYSFWHTNDDTLANISGENIKIVGDVLLNWIASND